MIRHVASVLLITTAGLATAAFAEPGSPSADTSTALLVELVNDARMIGFPAVCPGSSPEEDQSELICMAELYEVRARTVRNLGGPPVPHRLTIRFTAHSFHAVWRKQRRMLLIVAPFEDKGRAGYFAHYWDWEDDRGRFCKAADDIADWQESPIKNLYLSRPGRMTQMDTDDWNKGTVVHCVTGTERLAD